MTSRRYFSPDAPSWMRQTGAAGSAARHGAFGNPGRAETCPVALRQGTALDGGTYELPIDAYGLRIRGKVLSTDMVGGNSYKVAIYKSTDGGENWTFLGGGEHSTLADYEGKKAGRRRAVCLRLDWSRSGPPGLAKGTLVRAEFDAPNAMRVGIEMEAV